MWYIHGTSQIAYLGLRLIFVKVKNHCQELNIYICVFLGYFSFLTSSQGLFWTWRCLFWLVWLACLLCGFLVSTSHVLIIQGGRLVHSFLCGFGASRFYSSCLYVKLFTCWATSQVTLCVFLSLETQWTLTSPLSVDIEIGK